MDILGITVTPLLTTFLLILLSILYYAIKHRNVLPGPKGVPYLGLYPFLTDENLLPKFEEYKKKYGDMFSFTFAGKLFINLGSIKAMREIQLQKADCFAERPTDFSFIGEMVGNGLFLLNGEPWKIMRKFFIQKFKNYGLNAVRDDLAGPVYDSLNAAVEDLKVIYKKPVNILDFLSQHCSITMRKIIFGEKGVTDDEIKNMLIAFTGSFEGNLGVNVLLFRPFGKLLLFLKPSFRKNVMHINEMNKILLKCVKRIESSMRDEEPKCIVEEFYQERKEKRRNNDPSWKYFSDDTLVESLFQFVGDGIASIAGFIGGILNMLSMHPEEEEKIYNEIMEVVGPNRQPTAEDKPNMPYTNAFLNEYTRTSKFLAFFPSLECTKETTVRGYRIPVGSVTLLNFWSAHYDKDTFEDPEKFNPSRYLSNSGKPKAESPVMFGMGKRVCTGEPFVMLQSFLFLTTIVKNFKVTSSSEQGNRSMDFLLTGKLELTFQPRKEV